MIPKQQMVEVWWDDAHQTMEEYDVAELPDEMYICTVGYLVRENERSVWVSPEVFDDGRVRSCTRIPRGMVKEIRELRRTKSRSRKRIGEKS